MKLKSLRIACNCMDYDLAGMRFNDISLYNMITEARNDIDSCIKAIEKQLEDLKSADVVDALGTSLCFNILVDLPDRGYLKKGELDEN